MGVGGYDGMAAIAEVVKKEGPGHIDGDKAMEILKGVKMTSPRGPIAIDPATRDIVQTVYIRRVQKVGGEFYNVEFDKFPDVKDPGK
jgi:branched-chain amino acid transport system substrate-binding protein